MADEISRKPHVAISACLLGEPCTYRGDSNVLDDSLLSRLRESCCLVPICPETQGGLSAPRPPAERVGDRIVIKTGEDVTEQFFAGAAAALADAQASGCRLALLKERSPSCGFGSIYDGTFSGVTVPGDGVAARMLSDAGIEVYGESRIESLIARAKSD